ncbi:MAG TPA: response regulator transcription factor [Actinomycetales bacterium]|nr:response regulator transcription factor [Actinomycetales bacterium]
MSEIDATVGPEPEVEAITVLLADDQALLRMGFRLVLEAEDDLEVIGEASDGATAVKMVGVLHPDVMLMDVRMPGMNGIEATREIVRAYPATKVLILTTFDLDEYAFAGLRAGASGFLLKDTKPADLISAIRTVAAGDAVVSGRVTRTLLEMFGPRLPDAEEQAVSNELLASLTAREREVLALVARGMSNVEIAAELFVSETTVKTHVGNLLAKLGLRDRVQAVVFAYETGVVKPG